MNDARQKDKYDGVLLKIKMLCTVAVMHCKNAYCVYVSLEVIVQSSSVFQKLLSCDLPRCSSVLFF